MVMCQMRSIRSCKLHSRDQQRESSLGFQGIQVPRVKIKNIVKIVQNQIHKKVLHKSHKNTIIIKNHKRRAPMCRTSEGFMRGLGKAFPGDYSGEIN